MTADHPRPAIPFAVAAVGIALFSVMDAVMKDLSIAIGAYNTMLWRTAFGSLVTGAGFMLARGRWPGAAMLRLHLHRGVVAAGMALTFFWGLARLPMAEAIALSFISPFIALYLAAVMLGEKIGRETIAASLLGLAGVLVILSARLGQDGGTPDAWWAVASILVSAVLYAYNLILARRQAQRAGPVEIAFFQNLFVCMTLALAGPWLAVMPAAAQWPGLMIAAGLAIVSLMLASWAYARAEAQVLIPVEYTAFVWAALLGWWVFGEALVWQTVAGAALIVVGCLIVARRRVPVAAAATPAAS